MNLEKTINKNMFDMSSAIIDANPLAPSDKTKTEQKEQQNSPTSSPLSSLFIQPKQKLTTQFKRAITMAKQRSETSSDPPSIADKPLDSTVLASLIEEPSTYNDQGDRPSQMSSSSTVTFKPQPVAHGKSQPRRSSSNQVLPRTEPDLKTPSTATIVTMDPPSTRPNQPNSPSARLVRQSLQQIHSSILQTMHQHSLSPPTTSSSATLSPTPTSSSSTMGTGEVAILETIL
jgi:hypothetical protein